MKIIAQGAYMDQIFDGYSIYARHSVQGTLGQDKRTRTTRTPAPNARGGKFDRNFDFTTPELPCGRVTRLEKESVLISESFRYPAARITDPQMTRIFDP
jgi:hypothetical protein